MLTDGTGVQRINHFLALNVYFELLVWYGVVAYWTGGGEVDILFILGNIVSYEIDHIFAWPVRIDSIIIKEQQRSIRILM